MSKTKLNFWIHLVISATFLIMIVTGLALESDSVFLGLDRETIIDIHAVIGIVTLIGLTIHIAAHRQWLVTVFRRFSPKLAKPVRTNFVIDIALLVLFTLLNFTGLHLWIDDPAEGASLMRQSSVGQFPVAEPEIDEPLHMASFVLVLILSMVHLKRHWKWIKSSARRYTRRV